ncbi:MAG: heavy metal translocating P-type ATPase [Candidatus Moranbacteria bacterium]|nr:heavy metal translocating P-type ATPase [Candidatus Moranbacteria bacterium]
MIGIVDIVMSREFRLPLFLVGVIVVALLFSVSYLYVVAMVVGLGRLGSESYKRLRGGKWSLDYLALITLVAALVLQEWLAGAVIALMVAVSAALEGYGTKRAEKTLRGLFEALPKTVLLKHGKYETTVPLQSVQSGDILLIRPNELLAFDGFLLSPKALLNEANLTGEMEPLVYEAAKLLKSGSINVGEAFTLEVRGDFEHSSYRKILRLVEEGKRHPSPLTRLAERYNVWFSLLALSLAFGAYFLFGDWSRFLAVLVIATPCPLLIAAPMSFIGGLNKAARKNIIIKGPYALELLAKTKIFFFDKTGTLTLGVPRLQKIQLLDQGLDEEQALDIAAALEQHSFHPLARSLVREQEKRSHSALLKAQQVEEKIGEGIFGMLQGSRVGVVKARGVGGLTVDLIHEDRPIARFFFDDELKNDVSKVFDYLRQRGYFFGILTGDKKANAERLLRAFHLPIYAESTPEKKVALIKRYQQEGKLVGMIGDGVNDAPALALADIGIVFSGTENSASIEAADVALLGHDASGIQDAIHIGRRSYQVALQSITLGIGLSSIGMVLGFFGFIPVLEGAILQEVIDAVVIINALRSTY